MRAVISGALIPSTIYMRRRGTGPKAAASFAPWSRWAGRWRRRRRTRAERLRSAPAAAAASPGKRKEGEKQNHHRQRRRCQRQATHQLAAEAKARQTTARREKREETTRTVVKSLCRISGHLMSVESAPSIRLCRRQYAHTPWIASEREPCSAPCCGGGNGEGDGKKEIILVSGARNSQRFRPSPRGRRTPKDSAKDENRARRRQIALIIYRPARAGSSNCQLVSYTM